MLYWPSNHLCRKMDPCHQSYSSSSPSPPLHASAVLGLSLARVLLKSDRSLFCWLRLPERSAASRIGSQGRTGTNEAHWDPAEGRSG